jgi:hypothetical protein
LVAIDHCGPCTAPPASTTPDMISPSASSTTTSTKVVRLARQPVRMLSPRCQRVRGWTHSEATVVRAMALRCCANTTSTRAASLERAS